MYNLGAWIYWGVVVCMTCDLNRSAPTSARPFHSHYFALSFLNCFSWLTFSFFPLLSFSKEDPDEVSMLVVSKNMNQAIHLLVPVLQCLSHPFCLHPECTNNVMIELREVDSSYVTAEILAIVNGKDNLYHAHMRPELVMDIINSSIVGTSQ